MNVIVEINGRQAIPVRAIPLLTDWKALSPDQVAQILSGDDLHWQAFEGFTAYRVHPDGSTEQIPQRWWASWVVRKLQATSDAIKAQQVSHETGTQQWRRESLAQLPAGVFVWRDQLEDAHAGEYGPESLRAYINRETFNPSAYTLNFSPQPPPDIAPQHLVMEGFAPNESEGSTKAKQMTEWLNAPREELAQEYQDAFALWCEIDAIDQQIKELECTKPVGVTEILASRAALKELHTERARLLAVLEGGESPALAPDAQAEAGPPRILKKSAMVATYLDKWPTIDADINEAARNGLAVAKTDKKGMWYVDKAIEWARSKGKWLEPVQAHPITAAWSGAVTKNKIGN